MTQAMSAGPVACDVISLSCFVSVRLAYSQVCRSVKRRAARTGPNRPTLHLHPSLHLSSHLTLLYKISPTDIPPIRQALSSSLCNHIRCNNRTPRKLLLLTSRLNCCLAGFQRAISYREQRLSNQKERKKNNNVLLV